MRFVVVVYFCLTFDRCGLPRRLHTEQLKTIPFREAHGNTPGFYSYTSTLQVNLLSFISPRESLSYPDLKWKFACLSLCSSVCYIVLLRMLRSRTTFVTRVPRGSIVCWIYPVGMTVTWTLRLAKWWTRSTHALQTPGESGPKKRSATSNFPTTT